MTHETTDPCFRCGALPMEDQSGPAESWCGCFESEPSPWTPDHYDLARLEQARMIEACRNDPAEARAQLVSPDESPAPPR